MLVTMYLRTTKRRLKGGDEVGYLQLAHNEWDPERQRSVTRILYNFGREEAVDRDAIRRLIDSLARFLGPEEALQAGASPDLDYLASRSLGGAWALDRIWSELGVDATLKGLAGGRRIDPGMERVLFALVANRALEPTSKLGAAEWVSEDAAVPGLPAVDVDACYRAMDWLTEVAGDLEEAVWGAVANLLNLEVDLLFFDTTSASFEIDAPDPAPSGKAADEGAEGDEGAGADEAGDDDAPPPAGFRSFGHSHDHRPDLPQVVVGMAVTREGIPIRCWCFPGNTPDQTLIRRVKDDLRAWRLHRVVWVADRGFTSERNRRYLQRAGGHYILGERLRAGSTEAKTALARPGRYRTVAGNLRVKEVFVGEGSGAERFVVCHNPEQADRDRETRERLVALLQERISGSDGLPKTRRAELRGELRGELRATPGLHRYLRQTKGGLLRVDRTAVRADARLDGKFLLRTSDPSLSATDVALGYKQLYEVERGWRDIKHTLDLRPVYHRLERRIRGHVLLCWLALLLIRICELRTGETWRNVRRELQRMDLGEFTGPGGTVWQRTATTPAQRRILAALGVSEPPRFLRIDPEAVAESA